MPCATLLVLGLLGVRAEAASDPWPLVNAADRAVWGTLIHHSSGISSRLLVVRTEDAPDAPPVRIVDTVGDLPDGTPVARGARGLFLVTTRDLGPSEFAATEGTILVGGFLPGIADAATRARVERLIAPATADAPFDETDARALLEGDWAPGRRLAIGWWRDREDEPSHIAKAALHSAIERGKDVAELRALIELHLLRGWPVPTDRMTDLLLANDDPVLADLAVRGLASDGDGGDRSALLLAWRGADRAARVRLLRAYAALGIEEALPWWREAIVSDDPELTTVALREVARAGVPGSIRALSRVLQVEDPRLVALALEGLARSGSPEAGAAIRSFIGSREEDDPLVAKAERLLRHPRRYTVRPSRPSPLEIERR